MDLELETSSHESCCVAEGTSAISLLPFALLTVGTAFVETHRRIRERRLKTFLSLCGGREGTFADEHDVCYDAERPYILFFALISFAAQNLRAGIIKTGNKARCEYLCGASQ